MTPYWPSPLGATHRRLTSSREGQTFQVSQDPWRSSASASHRFPKPNRGIRWVAEADLPMTPDFKFGPDGSPLAS